MAADRTIDQAINVATLPGVQKHVTVLPDGHEGYGFPVGGVAAMDLDQERGSEAGGNGIIGGGGVVSPLFQDLCCYPYPLLIPSDIHVEVAFEIQPNVIQYTVQG
jgi:hypothetical protein